MINAGSIHRPIRKYFQINDESTDLFNNEALFNGKDLLRVYSTLVNGNDENEILSQLIHRPTWKRSKLNLHTNLNLPRYL